MKPNVLTAITAVFFFILAIVLNIASVLGTIPPFTLPRLALGNYQIAAFPTGLSIYQQDRGLFYTISPFDDYITDMERNRYALISHDQVIEKVYSSNYQKPVAAHVKNTILSYLGLLEPSIKFATSDRLIDYMTDNTSGDVIITRLMEMEQGHNIARHGFALGYPGGDLIFDEYGNLYTYQSNDTLDALARIYNIKLKPYSDDLQIITTSGRIFIMHPDLVGALELDVHSNQRIRIDTVDRKIEIDERVFNPNSNVLISSFKLKAMVSPTDINMHYDYP